MSRRSKLSPQQLADASEDLLYEIVMLRYTAEKLVSSAPDESPMVNALLESFAIHSRALFEFFFGGSGRDQMLAAHYVDHWSQPKPASLGKTVGKVNEEVAHLTYKRSSLSSEAKKWPLDKIVGAFDDLLEVFLKQVSDENLSDRMNHFRATFSRVVFRPAAEGTVMTSSTGTSHPLLYLGSGSRSSE